MPPQQSGCRGTSWELTRRGTHQPRHCSWRDGAYTNIDEFRPVSYHILFARGNDPYHHARSHLLDTYVCLQEAGLLQYRNSLAPEDPFSISDTSSWATASAASVITALTLNSVHRKVRTTTQMLRLHPTLVDGGLVCGPSTVAHWEPSMASRASGGIPLEGHRHVSRRLGHSGVN